MLVCSLLQVGAERGDTPQGKKSAEGLGSKMAKWRSESLRNALSGAESGKP
jgi:hypothetical protein